MTVRMPKLCRERDNCKNCILGLIRGAPNFVMVCQSHLPVLIGPINTEI